MPTQVINTRYEVIETEPHADGSPFVVSKARDVVEGRVVALQVLASDQSAGSLARRGPLRAAINQAMRLDSPNITRVYDQGEVTPSGDLYVVSEYIRAITLQERIRRVAPFSLTVAADIAVSVAEALDYAHRTGVIHGDLRPQDVLLSPEGQIKVANFAYARLASGGNPADPPAISDDISSLGAILYEMLTGKLPPNGSGGTPPSPRAANPGVPPALEGIVQKALHPDQSLRYRTISSMLLDLQAVRDALRNGRSLTWSPLTDKRIPRSSEAESTIISDPRLAVGAVTKGARTGRAPQAAASLTNAAEEIEDERYAPAERERGNPLGKILAGLFVLAVLGVIALVWYGSQFLSIPNDVQVPNLVGKTMDEAKQMALQQHFTLVEGGSDYSTKWPEDQIYQQDPLSGRTIKAGKDVTVFRSLGPRLLQVPRLVGETKDRAQSDLQEVGLPVGTVTSDYSDTVQNGVIVSQTPDPESMVARNTAVNFVVSKGRQPPDPPTDVEATASDMNTVDLHWDTMPRSDSYTVYRSLNGETTTVAKALADNHFTDRGLQPDTSYSYTVDAINASGASGASEAALVATPPKPVATPVLPKGTEVITPSESGSTPSLDGSTTTPTDAPKTPPTARMRQFTISFRVPRHPRRPRHVQIEVQDVTGTNLVYDETYQPGDTINAPVQGFGNKITLRIFIDGSLLKQQTM